MFQPGISGNPRGRPKGSFGGRAQALAELDRLLSKKSNRQTIVDALELGVPPLLFIVINSRAARQASPRSRLIPFDPNELP